MEILAALGLIALLLSSRTSSVADETTPTPGPGLGSQAFDSLFQKYGATFGVPWTWLKAFALTESNLGREPSVARGLAVPSDVSGSQSSDGKSWGLMQMTLETAADYDPNVTAEALNHPEYSVDLAAQHVAHLMRVFPIAMDPDVRLEAIVKAYNQGEGNEQAELDGSGGGFADAYWTRWQRNFASIGG